jgi:hypothetical protein
VRGKNAFSQNLENFIDSGTGNDRGNERSGGSDETHV